MIKSVVRQYHWSVSDVANLYLDNLDYKSLEFWYKDAKEIDDSLKKKK